MHIFASHTVLALACLTMVASCAKQKSSTTGWSYDAPRQGSMSLGNSARQAIPHDLEYIRPGNFACIYLQGYDTIHRRTNIPSFYISTYEESNYQYRVYLMFLQTYKPNALPAALPDTVKWLKILPPDYFSNPVFDNYPVLGLSIVQINNYLEWKTDRLYENILLQNRQIRKREIESTPFSFEEFTKNGSKWYGRTIDTKLLLPPYRLPLLAEWSYVYAATAGQANRRPSELRLSNDNFAAQIANEQVAMKRKYGLPNFKINPGRKYIYPNYKRTDENTEYLLYTPVNEKYAGESRNYFGIQNLASNAPERVFDHKVHYIIGGQQQIDVHDKRILFLYTTESEVKQPAGFRSAMANFGVHDKL